MGSGFKELYSKKDIETLKKRMGVWIGAACAVGGAALFACVFLCAVAARAHSNLLLPIMICISTVGGWIVITLYRFVIVEYRNALKHVRAMLEGGETETVSGRFTLTKDRLFIKNGVAIVRVAVEGEDSASSVRIYDKKKKLIPASFSGRAKTVYGFITAYEVSDDNP